MPASPNRYVRYCNSCDRHHDTRLPCLQAESKVVLARKNVDRLVADLNSMLVAGAIAKLRLEQIRTDFSASSEQVQEAAIHYRESEKSLKQQCDKVVDAHIEVILAKTEEA